MGRGATRKVDDRVDQRPAGFRRRGGNLGNHQLLARREDADGHLLDQRGSAVIFSSCAYAVELTCLERWEGLKDRWNEW